MSCGFDVSRIAYEYKESLAKNPQWNELRAVKQGRVFAINADSYSSKPSIRTVTGIKILSKIINPEHTSQITAPEGSYCTVV